MVDSIVFRLKNKLENKLKNKLIYEREWVRKRTISNHLSNWWYKFQVLCILFLMRDKLPYCHMYCSHIIDYRVCQIRVMSTINFKIYLTLTFCLLSLIEIFYRNCSALHCWKRTITLHVMQDYINNSLKKLKVNDVFLLD